MASRRVAVVGGGLAGLSAGRELRRAGHEVTLFERSRLLGGKATSFAIDGVEVDNGQHVYLACCTAFIEFVGSLPGLWDDSPPLMLQDRFDALLLARDQPPARLRAVKLPAPLHLGPALLRYGYLPLRERLGIAWAVVQARRQAYPGETFAAWLSRHGQSAAARARFWDPFLVPALNAIPEEVTVEDALFVIRTAFLTAPGAARFGYARVPLARIAEAAARELSEVRLRTPVVALDMDEAEPGESAIRGVQLEAGQTIPFEGVVLAVPPSRLARILDPASFDITGLDGFREAPIVDVHLWYDVPTAGFEFAALLESPIQWVFQKGAGYLCCSMSAAGEFVSWTNAALVDLCDRELRQRVPALRGATLLRGSATRDRDATPLPVPGSRRPGPLTRFPNVVIAGAWTDTGWPATMESAIRSGHAAARALTVQLSGMKLHAAA